MSEPARIFVSTKPVPWEIEAMTSRACRFEEAAPILVLGLGNILLHDDGFGPSLLEDLAREYKPARGLVEFLDGGTQGLALLGQIADRQALVILDAVSTGHEPGSVCVLEGQDVLRFATSRPATKHEGNAGELLATAAFLGELPEKCFIIAVEPKSVKNGMGLSRDVHRSLKSAIKTARGILDALLAEVDAPVGA
jgi:hydrogenase maturation protease